MSSAERNRLKLPAPPPPIQSTGPVGLREVPDADGAVDPDHDHLGDLALLGEVSDGARHVEEMGLAVEQEKDRVASVLRPSVALREGDAVDPVLVEDGGMDAPRLADDDRIFRTGGCSEAQEQEP